MSFSDNVEDKRKARDIIEILIQLLGPKINIALSIDKFRLLCELYEDLKKEGIPSKILKKCFEKRLTDLLKPIDKDRIKDVLTKPTVYISYSFSDKLFKKFIEETYIEGFLEKVLSLSCIYAERDLEKSFAPGEQIIGKNGLISQSQILIAFCTKDIKIEKAGLKIYYPSENVIGEIHSAKSSGLDMILVFKEDGVSIPSNLGTSITWVDFKKTNKNKIFIDTLKCLSQKYAIHWINLSRIR